MSADPLFMEQRIISELKQALDDAKITHTLGR
jgi:hypothetical protein